MGVKVKGWVRNLPLPNTRILFRDTADPYNPDKWFKTGQVAGDGPFPDIVLPAPRVYSVEVRRERPDGSRYYGPAETPHPLGVVDGYGDLTICINGAEPTWSEQHGKTYVLDFDEDDQRPVTASEATAFVERIVEHQDEYKLEMVWKQRKRPGQDPDRRLVAVVVLPGGWTGPGQQKE